MPQKSQKKKKTTILTKRTIEKAKYKGDGTSACILWDQKDSGLGLRVFPTGKKSFVLFYRNEQGTKRLLTLGRFGSTTLDEARKLAQKAKGEVADKKDPLEARRSARQGTRFRDFAQDYLSKYALKHKRSAKEDQRRIEDRLIPDLGAKLTKSITRKDVEKLFHKIGDSAPYEANRCLSLLSAMFNWGISQDTSLDHFKNPAVGHKRFKEEERDRWVLPDEMPRLAAGIREEENLYVRAAFWLLLLTGARKTELLNSKWEDVQISIRRLRLPKTKSGKIKYISLSPQAMQIIDALPKLEGNPYILPGRRSGRPLVNISKPWSRIRKRAGLMDVTIHDLRRTTGAWLINSGVSAAVVREALNHSNLQTTMVYARLAQKTTEAAIEAHGSQLSEFLEGQI